MTACGTNKLLLFAKHPLRLALALALFAAAPYGIAQRSSAAAGARESAASPASVLKMRKVNVTTPVRDLRSGQQRSIEGLTMLVPADWSFQGSPTLSSRLDCNYTAGRFNVETPSPDKSTGLQIRALGAAVWTTSRPALQQIQQMNQQWSSILDCKVEAPKDMSAALPAIVPQLVENGRAVSGVEPVPGLSEQVASSMGRTNQMLAQQSAQRGMPPSHMRAEAGRVRFTGTLAGKEVEGWVVALHTVRSDPAPGGMVEMSDLPLFAVMFAPKGQLEASERLFSAMLDSVRVEPEWTAYIAQFIEGIQSTMRNAMNQVAHIYAQMAIDNAHAAQQQADIRRGTQDYANKVRSSVASDRAAALDHSAQQFAMHMGDQAVYRNPSTGQQVQMSNQYSHAWASTTGNSNEYILTDSPSFDPNGHAGSGSWTQLQPQP